MDYNQLEALVIEWAENKGILKNGTSTAQAAKTLEEAAELFIAAKNNDIEELKDSLGDVLVTIIIQAKMKDVSLLECLEGAYNVIAKRKGVMRDGQFYKDA
jgi:NTP pyrophosphatase (non-canonical NTP hydrolase)